MSFEANLKAEDDGRRRYSRKNIVAVTAYLLLCGVAIYGFQSCSTLQQCQKTVPDATFPNDSSNERNETFSEEIGELRAELRRTQNELFQVQEKHLKLLTDIQANTKEIAAARTNGDRDTAVEAMTEAIESDPYHRWMLDRRDSLPSEFREYVAPKKLKFGWNPALKSDSLTASVGQACVANMEDITKFMSYEIGKVCPDDDDLAQKLLLQGCEPLPRRRCLARGPENATEPLPFPQSLWTLPIDGNIHWTPYDCKSFDCLNTRAQRKVFADCLDCFDLDGRERHRWVGRPSSPGAVDFTVEQVVRLKQGGLRIGLDIGGGTGSFAVRMREHNVTIITSTLNLNGPFNNFIAQRGVIPFFMSIGVRFPFWDNTLDIVHSMHVLSNWIPIDTLEFIFYDIDRVLRPGGFLWLDHFFCIQSELDSLYAPLIRKFGYKELRWDVGLKLDRGADKHEVYLSALLEKPLAARN